MTQSAPDGRLVNKIEKLEQRIEDLERSLGNLNLHLAESRAPVPAVGDATHHRRAR